MPRHVFPKRAIFRMLLRLSWERGEWTWTAPLSVLLRNEAA